MFSKNNAHRIYIWREREMKGERKIEREKEIGGERKN